MKYTIDNANKFIQENKDAVNQKHRHKLHIMPEIGWMNDPNGLVFYKGEYHAFFQYYPYESVWGPMHWGHAKSKDLYNWEALPVALAPDLPHEQGCFSGGSAVLDDKLYLLYTSHFVNGKQLQEQSIAIMDDEGVFNKYLDKPVLTIDELPEGASKVDFRDPNVYSKDGENFVLIGSKNLEDEGQFLVYKTDDYKEYKYFSTIGPNKLFGNMAECPDLFELDGKHVLLFSGTNLPQEGNRYKNVNSSLYAVGDFNTNTGEFKIDHIDEIDLGHHFYAPQTYFNDKGERIMMGWMNMWEKEYYTAKIGHNWTGALTFPRQLRVVDNKLIQLPYNTDQVFLKEVDLDNNKEVSKVFKMNLVVNTESKTTVQLGNDDDFITLSIDSDFITLDTSTTKLYPLEKRYVENTLNKEVEVELYMDNSSLELFIKNIDKTITTLVYFDEETLQLNIKGGEKNIEKLQLWEK